VKYQFLVCADYVNMLGEEGNTIKENRNSESCKEVGLEVNTEETKYIFISRLQNI
jgi:hypothetical protein